MDINAMPYNATVQRKTNKVVGTRFEPRVGGYKTCGKSLHYLVIPCWRKFNLL